MFVAMKLSNAETLMDLSDRKRTGEKWLKLAAEKSMAEFDELIETELDGNEKPSASRERVVPITIKMPKSRKKIVEQRLLE